MKYDHVDVAISQWHKERPDINPSPMAVMGRIFRYSAILNHELKEVLSLFSLSSGEFDVLAMLLRDGKPYTQTPNQLLKQLIVSSGAMTNRIDKLERKAFIIRKKDPKDRRGIKVCLTTQGYTMINKVIAEHLKKQQDILRPFSPLNIKEQKSLATLLKKLIDNNSIN